MQEANIRESLWTIIIFANCENNSFLYIEEIYNEISQNIVYDKGNGIQDVNFIMLVDTPDVTVDDAIQDEKYKFFKTDGTGYISNYRVQGNSNFRGANTFYESSDLPEDDLSKQVNLERHLKEIKKLYPAKRYGFIYKSHGGNTTDIPSKYIKSLLFKSTPEESDKINFSIKNNYCYELPERVRFMWSPSNNLDRWELQTPEHVGTDTDESPIFLLTLIEKNVEFVGYDTIRHALVNSFNGNGLEFILMDCCWGMRYELLNIFKGTCKYYIGSPDQTPLKGIGYDIWSKELLSFPNIKGNELANMLVAQFYIRRFDDYYDHTDIGGKGKNQFYKYGVSITAVDMAQFKQTAVNLSAFSTELLNLMNQEYESTAIFSAIKSAREKCTDFTYTPDEENAYPLYNIDCIWFIENIIHQFSSLKHVKSDKMVAAAYKLILQIKLKLITGFLSNNYEKAEVTSKEKNNGGYGITLRFAKKKQSEEQITTVPGYLQFIKYENKEWDMFVEKYHSSVQ